MLACLPASGDSTIPLLSCTQMNTGPQRWETTQKMRSTSYPTPAELDAYAKKVANNPLTIQIFPNSVKVPQRKHIRRTVNGLDTSSSQRHSPYPSQLSANAGLLAVLRAPVKEPPGTRGRALHKAGMNLHDGPYGPQSTVNSAHMQGPSQSVAPTPPQQPPMTHPMGLPQTLPQTVPHSQALQHRGLSHPGPLQRQQSLSKLQTPQKPPYLQGLQRQQSVPLPQQCAPPVPAQHIPHLHTLKRHGTAHALVPPPQELRHMLELHMPHAQPLSQTVTAGPPTGPPGGGPLPGGPQPGLPGGPQPGLPGGPQPGLPGGPQPGLPGGLQLGPPGGLPLTSLANTTQQPPSGHYGPRKLPDADAPPNVTVSTSTIPLSMAASLHQSRPGDLSSIVLQINQLCQARAGLGATSVCEGQIANPSPISRNLLINASSRVAHPLAPGSTSSFLMAGGLDKAPVHTPAVPLHSQLNMSTPNAMQSFHGEAEKGQHHLQRSWAQHQLAHMQQPPEGAHPCKNPRMEPSTECGFAPPQNLSYPHKVHNSAQSFPLKHPDKPRASPPLNCPGTSMPYLNGQYVQRPWGSGPQEVAGFPGPRSGSSDRIPGAKYRPGKEDLGGQPKLLPNVDFLPGDFQMQSFRDQSVDVMGPRQEPSASGAGHSHHSGYR